MPSDGNSRTALEPVSGGSADRRLSIDQVVSEREGDSVCLMGRTELLEQCPEAASTSTDSSSDAAGASSSLVPPESFGDSEAGFNLGGLTIPFMGFLTLLLVGSVWALWRLTLALDDEPTSTATMTTDG